jgi:hypothetical protein
LGPGIGAKPVGTDAVGDLLASFDGSGEPVGTGACADAVATKLKVQARLIKQDLKRNLDILNSNNF